jgi:hypothetical protein
LLSLQRIGSPAAVERALEDRNETAVIRVIAMALLVLMDF